MGQHHHHCSPRDGLTGAVVHYSAIDRGALQRHLARVQHRLQPSPAIALDDDRGAGVEVDIKVHSLTGGHREFSSCNLSGRDFDPGLQFAGEQQRHRISDAWHDAVHSRPRRALIATDDIRGLAVARENDPNLLVGSGLNPSFVPKGCQEAGAVRDPEQVHLHRGVFQIGCQVYPAGFVRAG